MVHILLSFIFVVGVVGCKELVIHHISSFLPWPHLEFFQFLSQIQPISTYNSFHLDDSTLYHFGQASLPSFYTSPLNFVIGSKVPNYDHNPFQAHYILASFCYYYSFPPLNWHIVWIFAVWRNLAQLSVF